MRYVSLGLSVSNSGNKQEARGETARVIESKGAVRLHAVRGDLFYRLPVMSVQGTRVLR